MSKQLKLYYFIPDTHVPYHDRRAWELFLKVARTFKPHGLRVLGDFGDFYGVSSHSKDPRRRLKTDWEIVQANKALSQLDDLGAKDKEFIAGNHEDRLQRYLQDNAPELIDLLAIPKLYRLEKRGWNYVSYKHDAALGKLYLTHDVGSAGRNAVFKCLDTYQHSNVTGHTHRMAYIVEGNAVGEHKLSAQFGWLGDVSQVDYMHQAKAKKDWALGFGLGYFDVESGLVYVTPVPIIKYTCVVNGRLFKN